MDVAGQASAATTNVGGSARNIAVLGMQVAIAAGPP
jgi:hypothetical protein